jgi:hypothetical protein
MRTIVSDASCADYVEPGLGTAAVERAAGGLTHPMRIEPRRRAFCTPHRACGCSDELAQQCPKSRRGARRAEPELDHEVAVQNANGRVGSPDPMHREDADRERRCWSPNASRRWIHILPPQHRAPDRSWLRILPRGGSALRGHQSAAHSLARMPLGMDFWIS